MVSTLGGTHPMTSEPRLFHRQQLLLHGAPHRPLLQQLPDGLSQPPPAAQLGAARGHAAVVLGGPAEVFHEERHVLPENLGKILVED